MPHATVDRTPETPSFSAAMYEIHAVRKLQTMVRSESAILEDEDGGVGETDAQRHAAGREPRKLERSVGCAEGTGCVTSGRMASADRDP
jgi:hypothetical protein